MTTFDALLSIYARGGGDAYFGEAVTQAEHALQTAHFAQAAGAPAALVAAALLHDIGHLLESVPEDIAAWTVDAGHEVSGGRWLAAHFGPAVAEPVRLHVAAKRYLCAQDPDYFGRLSAASVATLRLQGGPLSPAEVATLEREPYWRDAVQLRRWDDRGKVPDLEVADFAHYRGLIDALAARSPATRAARARPLK